MTKISIPERLNKVLVGETIESVEIGPENVIIWTENGLQIEIYHNMFFDGQELISDDGMAVEVTGRDGKTINTEEI